VFITPSGKQRLDHQRMINQSNLTEGKMANFVYTLSKNDVSLATRCFQFAKLTHEKGHTVNIFLIEDGTLWADNTRDFKEKAITGDIPDDYFPYLVENEIPIGV
jgi:sulfur relay (sulfurtransferase) complex TusBCD TusD component (DsrE family)